MKLEPLVSVVIPTYNGADHIAQTLRCVLAQSHPAVEVVVVDDGSTDATVALVQSVCPSALLLRQPNARVSAARNAGLAAAKGQFVSFLDQDDVWHPQHLERQLRHFDAHPELGVVFSHFSHWHPTVDGYPEPELRWGADPGDAAPDPDFHGWIYHQFLLDCWALTSATLIRRATLEQHGTFEPDRHFAEDWDLWLRLAQQVQFSRVDWPPVLYRQHPEQGSRVARPIDHRCELLLKHVARSGLASRDGRAVGTAEFAHRIARYQAAFGYFHLWRGDARLGTRALWAAWRRRPAAARTLALAVAGSLGWRPQDRANESTHRDHG